MIRAKFSIILMIAVLEISNNKCFGRHSCHSASCLLYPSERLLKQFSGNRGYYAPVIEHEWIDLPKDAEYPEIVPEGNIEVTLNDDKKSIDVNDSSNTDSKTSINIEAVSRDVEIPVSLATNGALFSNAKIPSRKDATTVGTKEQNSFNKFPTCETGCVKGSTVCNTFQLSGTNTINNNFVLDKLLCQENIEPEGLTLRSALVRRRRNTVPISFDEHEQNAIHDSDREKRHTEENQSEFETNPETARNKIVPV